MNTAAHLREQGVPLQPGSILCVVFDGDHCLTHTEATLDTWWANLSPEHKATIYETDLDSSSTGIMSFAMRPELSPRSSLAPTYAVESSENPTTSPPANTSAYTTLTISSAAISSPTNVDIDRATPDFHHDGPRSVAKTTEPELSLRREARSADASL